MHTNNANYAIPIILCFSLFFYQISAFTIDLIHRDSPLSPFHNSSKSPSQLLQNAAFRSLSRSKRLNNNNSNGLQTEIHSANDDPSTDYIMRIYVGTPPVEMWAILDSGSNFVWLQCKPCATCFHQDRPFFDPKKSHTYKTVSCESESCIYFDVGYTRCGFSKQCSYFFNYADGTTTKGEFAWDLISFEGQSGNLVHHGAVFGCGHINRGLFLSNEVGIVGLGNGPLSLITQLGPKIGYKFSYCLVPSYSNFTSRLKFGDEATISESNRVVSTPFTNIPGSLSNCYFLTLEGVTVGKKTTKIGESEDGSIMIDSGTTGTILPLDFYIRVEALVKEAIGVKASQNPAEDFNLCYLKNETVAYRKIKELNFVVHFKGSAKVSLTYENTFVPQDDMMCFMIFPTEDGTPIYGNVAQFNFEIEFDIKGQRVSFAPADCTKRLCRRICKLNV